MRRGIALLLVLFGLDLAGQQALKVVVLDGEAAVNIIQQKTAVRALVEVRDSNNLPVPGATVTFAIASKGGASVAGAQSITLVTNATGQAALTGVTPLTSGGLQISVNATFNGLTATASISQTVVTTTAAAVGGTAGAAGGAASTAGAAGGAAGATGGAAGAAGAVGAAGAAGAATGGLSIATVAGIVGGAAAVGGGVAAAGGSSSRDTPDPGSSAPDPTGGSGPPPAGLLPSCEFVVSPEDILVGNEGATIGLTIVMRNVDPCYDPSWRVDVGNAASWISVSPLSGARNGTAILTVAPYAPTPAAPNRVATIIVAYERILISQPLRSALPPFTRPSR